MPLQHTREEVVLPSGARGLVVDVPGATTFSSTIHFRAGNDYAKTPAIHQVAHLMEHMAFGPNAEYDSVESFSQVFTENGAYSNASTSDVAMNYYADSALFEWQRILALQQLAITKPTFVDSVLQSEKGNVREELTGQIHNNPRVMWQAVNRAIGSHSLIDTEKIATIDTVTIEDVIEHHTRTHTAKNMRFILGGDFGAQGVQEITQLLSGWDLPEGERLAPIIDTIHGADPISIKKSDQENSNFGFLMVLPRQLSDSEQMIGVALNHILTGTFHSRIFGKARTQGICYGMGSGMSVYADGVSDWSFHGQVRPENADQLMALIVREVRSVADGHVSDSEIAAAKRYLTGDYQMRGQTVGSLVGWYGSDYFFDGSHRHIREFLDEIEAISTGQIVKLAQEFLAAKVWTLGEIGNVSRGATERHYAQLSDLF